MSEHFKVSFNSPQCGFMSIGFKSREAEFNTTTAHQPHENALPNLLGALSDLLDANSDGLEFLVRWNRDPEEFDFWFKRIGDDARLEIWQYPSGKRNLKEREKAFVYEGNLLQFAAAFHKTFVQMRQDSDTDAFEQNWRQPFPEKSFERFDRAFRQAQPAAVL